MAHRQICLAADPGAMWRSWRKSCWCPEHREWPPCFCLAKCIDGNTYPQKREPWPSHSAVIFWKMKLYHLRFLNSNYHLFFQFTHSVMSNKLQPHALQHARLPCPSPTPGACSNPCPLCRWCHPTISSSVIPFSSCLQSFPASGFFPLSQFFTSGGQSIGVSASASVLPMNFQSWFPLDWLVGSPCSPKDSRVFSNITVWKHQFFSTLPSLWSNSHIHTWDYWKNHSFDYTNLCQQNNVSTL